MSKGKNKQNNSDVKKEDNKIVEKSDSEILIEKVDSLEKKFDALSKVVDNIFNKLNIEKGESSNSHFGVDDKFSSTAIDLGSVSEHTKPNNGKNDKVEVAPMIDYDAIAINNN